MPTLTHTTRMPCAAFRIPFGWTARPPAWPLVMLALIPVAAWYGKRLNDGSDEPLGLLVLVLALGLGWQQRRSLHAGPCARTLGAMLVLGSVLAIGVLPPILRGALGLAGAAVWCGTWHRPGLLGLTVLSLPVIASLQFYLGFPLRLAASAGAVEMLQCAGLVAHRAGVNIELAGQVVGVDPACGGIRMLWHALVAAMAMAAMHRNSWRASFAAGLLAVALVIPANIVRATWLALEESGRFPLSGLGHGGIGLVCFAGVLLPLWILLSKRSRPPELKPPSAHPRRRDHAILLTAVVLAPVLMARHHAPVIASGNFTPPATFTFNRVTLPLTPLPPTPGEAAFARSFPGALSSHRWGRDQVILRQVNTATRRLHPSRDCLTAAGYLTTDASTVHDADGNAWSRFSATRGGVRLTVHERIVSLQDGATWTDVPTWFWSALRHPLNGPWRAETVISGDDTLCGSGDSGKQGL